MNFVEMLREAELERRFKFIEPLSDQDLVDSFKKWCQETGLFFVREEVEI